MCQYCKIQFFNSKISTPPVDKLAPKSQIVSTMKPVELQKKSVQKQQVAEIPYKLSAKQEVQTMSAVTLKELPNIPWLPETFQIQKPMGRGSSHKINFDLNVSDKLLLTTGPDKLSMLQKEIQYYKRLNEVKIRAPIVENWTAYQFLIDKELRVGYVATKVTNSCFRDCPEF
jgi:hypothetical protein